jgi:hypothetical protein
MRELASDAANVDACRNSQHDDKGMMSSTRTGWDNAPGRVPFNHLDVAQMSAAAQQAFTAEELDGFRAHFDAFDLDGSGAIDQAEVSVR